jgi:hypothetical protein
MPLILHVSHGFDVLGVASHPGDALHDKPYNISISVGSFHCEKVLG